MRAYDYDRPDHDPNETLRQPAAPQKKRSNANRGVLIAFCCIAVLVLVLAILVSKLLSNPLALAGRGIKNSVDALQQSEIVSLVSDVTQKGSVELRYSVDEAAIGIPLEADASLKIYTALPDRRAAVLANVNVDGEPLLDASVLADQKSVAVGSRALLGSEYYGIVLDEDFADRFDNSVFGYDGAYSLGIERNGAQDGLAADAKKAAEETEEITKLITTAAIESLSKHADASKARDTLEFADKEVSITAVQVDLDAEALAKITADMVVFFRDNEKVRTYLENRAADINTVSAALGMEYDASFEEMIDELYSELRAIELDEAAIEELENNIRESVANISVVFQISNFGKELVGVVCSGMIDGETIEFSAQAGPSWKELNEISFRFENGYTTYRGAYVVKTKDSSRFESALEIFEDSETVFSGRINHDRISGDFAIDLTDSWGDVYGAKGNLKKTDQGVDLVLDTLYGGGQEIKLGITAILNRSDEMPEMPQFTDVLDMNESEIQSVLAEVEDAVYSLGAKLEGF